MGVVLCVNEAAVRLVSGEKTGTEVKGKGVLVFELANDVV